MHIRFYNLKEKYMPNDFGTQNFVSLQLFNLVLNIVRTRNELERAWEALAQKEELIDQIRNPREQYMYTHTHTLRYLY